MSNLIKKAALTGVGLALMTKDKVKKLGKDLVKQGEMSEEEGKEFVADLVKKSEEACKDLDTKIQEAVSKAVSQLNVATKNDVAELAARIERLEGKRGE